MVNVFKNVKFIDGSTRHIAIRDGVIEKITTEVIEDGIEIMLPSNVYVSPGWIDIHTHAFPKFEPYCSHPDDIGYATGVTTVVDAGSSGADDIDAFFKMSKDCKTNVLSIINISRIGLREINELADLNNISYQALKVATEKYPDEIVGLKARMSASVVDGNNIIPLDMAKEFSKELGLPVMVHIGSAPPKLADVLKRLSKGDIITHCYNAKENNHIFAADNKTELLAAIKRGVYLDVGHGTASFSYEIAEQAKDEEIFFDTISTDIYQGNMKKGPVYNMATTLSKFLNLGYSLEQVIRSVTEVPAKIINKPEIGMLKVGSPADLTFFTVEEDPTTLVDSLGMTRDVSTQIKAHSVVIGGNYYVCK